MRSVAGVLSLSSLLVVAACGQSTPATPAPDVWAVVNGTEIRQERVDRYYRSMAASQQGTPTEEEALAAKLSLLEELINDELVLAKAKALNITLTGEEIDKAVAERRGEMSDADFAKELQARQITPEQFREEVTRDVTAQKVFEQEVTNKVVVTDAEVTAFFEKNRAQFNVPERQYHLAQIVVSGSPSQINNRRNDDARSPGEAQRKLNMIAERLKAGDSFAALAADFSEDPQSAQNGGDLGMVPQSTLDRAPAQLRSAVMAMKPGSLNTMQSGDAATLLALVRIVEPGQRELSDPEVKTGIQDGLKSRRQEILQAAFVAKLRSDATVVNNLARQIVEAQGKVPAGAAAK